MDHARMGKDPLSADKCCLQQFAPLHSVLNATEQIKSKVREKLPDASRCRFSQQQRRPLIEIFHRPITPAALSPELPGITLARLYIKPPSCYRVGRPTDDPVVSDHIAAVTCRCNRRSNVAPTKALVGGATLTVFVRLALEKAAFDAVAHERRKQSVIVSANSSWRSKTMSQPNLRIPRVCRTMYRR